MVHPIRHRGFAAGFLAILSLTWMLAPNETFAHSGGGSGGHGGGGHGHGGASSHTSSLKGHGHIRRRAGVFLPGYYGPYGPYTTSAPAEQPAENNPAPAPANVEQKLSVTNSAPEREKFIFIFRPSCGTEAVTVPWSSGKPHTVNIVRC
jgi:hypothetical protein